MQQSKNITATAALILALIAAASPRALAGTAKTGGTYEIISDTVSKSGAAPFTGGTMTLYQNTGQQAGNDSSSGGTFSLTGGFLGVVDETPPTLSCSSPDALSSNTGSLAIAGAVFDENNSTWSVSYGPGASPSLWKQLSSGSTNTASSTLATWDASNLWGTYTVKISASDSRGNTSSLTRTISVWNTYTFSTTIPADKWSMVSLPGNPQNPDPTSFLGSGRYEVQRWDPAQAPDENNNRYKIVFPVTAGDGFWIKPYKTPISYTMSAWVQDTTTNVEKRLDKGWNQMGMPFNRAVAWSNFQFKRDGDAAAVPMNTAISNGWIDSKFYSYSDNAYSGNDPSASMQPFTGYFVCADVAGTLILDPGAGVPGGVARIVRPVYDFRMQISAETDQARDTENFIGEMKGASDAFGREDSAEPPTVKPFVSVYIERPDWARASDRFAEDIRATQQTGGASQWKLTVETDEPNKQTALKLPGAALLPENYRVTIRDDASGREFDPRAENEYTFTTGADGKRTFTVTASRLSPLNAGEVTRKTKLPAGWSLISVPLETSETDVRAQLGSDLPKIDIYQYYDKKLLTPDSEDRVDIQAGIGYWAYAKAPAEVEFRGVPTSSAAPVEVPLIPGWNLIGNPFDAAMQYGDNITATRDGQTLPLADAIKSGWFATNMIRYSQESDKWDDVLAGSVLGPGEGYAIKANVACAIKFTL